VIKKEKGKKRHKRQKNRHSIRDQWHHTHHVIYLLKPIGLRESKAPALLKPSTDHGRRCCGGSTREAKGVGEANTTDVNTDIDSVDCYEEERWRMRARNKRPKGHEKKTEKE
jgi:hypothetical protein